MDLQTSLTVHGAARSTTGSRHLVSVDGTDILLDCGLYQGRRKKTFERNKNFGFSPRSLPAGRPGARCTGDGLFMKWACPWVGVLREAMRFI